MTGVQTCALPIFVFLVAVPAPYICYNSLHYAALCAQNILSHISIVRFRQCLHWLPHSYDTFEGSRG